MKKNLPDRHQITIKEDETIALCRCWHSKSFPLCDGSHRQHPDKKGPVIVKGPTRD